LGLWGQEPTLTLQYVTKLLPDLFDYLPNINSIDLSTNGTGKPEDIVDFIAAINTYHHKDIELFIQWSYDGMDKYRGISAAAVIRNIKAVLKLINTIEFNNMKIKMRAHRVISCELLKDLERDNSIDTYYNNLYYFDRSLNYSNSNFDIDFYPTLGFEMPLNVTKEDGIRLSEFMAHDRIPYSETVLNIIKQYNCQTFDEFCHLFLKDKEAAS